MVQNIWRVKCCLFKTFSAIKLAVDFLKHYSNIPRLKIGNREQV